MQATHGGGRRPSTKMNLRLPRSIGEYVTDLAQQWTMPVQTLLRTAVIRALEVSPDYLDLSPNLFGELVVGQPMSWSIIMLFQGDLAKKLKDLSIAEQIPLATLVRILVLRGLPLLTGLDNPIDDGKIAV